MDFKLIAPRKVGTTGLTQVLLNRGFSEKEIGHFLNTTDEDIIDPSSIDNIREGAKMLVKHIQNNSPTYLQVDSDCDGFTSSAILLNYLNNYFPYYVQNCVWYSFHDGKQHGIDLEAIPEGTKFIICPDASSEEYDKHAELAAAGIDVLIIDHHNAERVSENACVINNQLCDYPTNSLSGAGMVYKFCAYLDSLLGGENKADDYLDLVSLGCIADVMPLTDCELRQLINKGLTNVNNPFLRSMIAKNSYSMKGKVIPSGVAFYVAPTVNAVTRIGMQEDKKLLFDSMLDFKAYKEIPSTKRGCKGQTETVVEQAVRNSSNVKSHQADFRDEFSKRIQQQIEEQNLLDNKILTILIEKPDENSKNITGLIANKLMSEYQRPVLLLSRVEEDGKIFWRGSGRNVGDSAIDSFQEFLKSTGLVEYANGHDNALGVSIPDENIDEFISTTNKLLENAVFDICYNVDLVYESDSIDNNDILSIADADNLWGQGISEPYIAITNLGVGKFNTSLLLNKYGKDSHTLKITVKNDLTILKFGVTSAEYDALMPGSDYGVTLIDIVGRCTRNTAWDNNPQIMMEDYEIKKRNNYYF